MAYSKQTLILCVVGVLASQLVGCDLAFAHGSNEPASGLPVLRATGEGNLEGGRGKLEFLLLEPVSISGGYENTGDNTHPVISQDAHVVVFQSNANELAGGNPNGVVDLVLFDVYDHGMIRLAPTGIFPNGNSESASLSGNGDMVAFESNATNLVVAETDTNQTRDVFVYDRRSASIIRISTSFTGEQSDGASHEAQVSSSGLYVAFASDATNLVPGDDNGSSDVFAHSLETGLTELVSVKESGDPAPRGRDSSAEPCISGDGRFVVFSSYAALVSGATKPGVANIYLRDRVSEKTQLVSRGLGGAAASRESSKPSISDDGNWVVFSSTADNLTGDDKNQRSDVFLFDRERDELRLISQNFDGNGSADGDSFSPHISGDGKYVVFQSNMSHSSSSAETTAFDVYIHDVQDGSLKKVLENSSDSDRNQPAISSAGLYLTYAGVGAGNEEDPSLQYSSVYLVKLRD